MTEPKSLFLNSYIHTHMLACMNACMHTQTCAPEAKPKSLGNIIFLNPYINKYIIDTYMHTQTFAPEAKPKFLGNIIFLN